MPGLFSKGPPASVFVRLQDLEAARGAIQGEPPELTFWVQPMDELLVGQRLELALQLPDGRFAQIPIMVRDRSPVRVLLTFPDAPPEDLSLLDQARWG